MDLLVKKSDLWVGGSFHNTIVQATPNQIISVLGKPECEQNNGRDKSNFDWNGVTDCGIGFTVYDWKYYRPLDMDETVDFHIGGDNREQTEIAATKLRRSILRAEAKGTGLSGDEFETIIDVLT